MRHIKWVKCIVVAAMVLVTMHSYAWVYPEHRQIALIAIGNLSTGDREILNKLWAEARVGYEKRLTETVIDLNQSVKPLQLDYAAWFAISGDHSCSPENLLHNVLETEWILKVADVCAKLKIGLATSKNEAQHVNALRESDISLQRVDPEYATRAGSNNVHFLLARPDVNTDAKKYARACFTPGSPLNALGAYVWFHISALNKAARYAKENLSPEQKSALILAAMADEAFALHFLEDAFAAGHIAGTRGDAAVRKGTHDYYNEKGLEVTTWDGKRMVLKGDAYMRQEDADVAAASVRMSLEQFINAASGKMELNYSSDSVSMTDKPDTFSVCKNSFTPARNVEARYMIEILAGTPVPGLASGIGEYPRFRSELGPFIGISSSLNITNIYGGFGTEQHASGFVGGAEANFRWGIGLDGVLNEAGDGLLFIQAGWKLDGSSSSSFSTSQTTVSAGTFTAAIPARTGYNFRLRAPFYLIPGDLILLGPILYLISPATITKMAVIAANGGLIPWQSAITTSFGRFQFVLGREIGVTLYGLNKNEDQMIIPTGTKTTIVQYKSTYLDFPILEYRPFRTFSMDQTSSMMVQITTGVDLPHGASVLSPAGDPLPALEPVWHLGVRILFDWRHYN